jgi:hypothetical protein
VEEEDNGTYTDLFMEELDVLNSFVENGGCISLKERIYESR